jgi:hypothetical protein
MFDLLENKRFQELQGSAVKLQGDLLYSRRCPKCTLCPPCKHYASEEELMADVRNFVASDNFKSHLSPKKRQSLMRVVRDPAMMMTNFNTTNMTHMAPIMESKKDQLLIQDPSMQRLHDLGHQT